jgi:UDP-2-acetamido-3-amino-2,3-dideoxy-glucuronate N-acetyltransferase
MQHSQTDILETGYWAHASAVIDSGAIIGHGTKIWHFAHIMPGSSIGRRCVIGQNVFVATGAVIGDSVKVQNNVSVYEGVVCEDDVFIGPSAVFTNVTNPRSSICRKHQYKPTVLRRGATIGANATIICGNEIGSYAMVGAGTVVTKPVPAFAIVAGNPARHIGWASKAGHRLSFSGGIAVCPEGGEKYRLKEGKICLCC